MNINDVAIEESDEMLICPGSKVISENGKTFWVGNPFCIVLNWNVTGISLSSFDEKNTSHLVRKIPVSSSTVKDCARGSYHVGSLIVVLVFEPIAPPEEEDDDEDTAIDSNSCLFWILAFLTETIFSWTVSMVPSEINPSSAIVVAAFWSFRLLFTKVKTLFPVANLGLSKIFGFGIKKLPIKVADKSDINLILVIVAWAPLVCPTKIMPLSTHPLYSPWNWDANEKVSTFKILEVDE